MSTPPAEPEAPLGSAAPTTPPSRGRAALARLRRLSGKDIALLALGLSFFGMSAYAFRNPLAVVAARLFAGKGEKVAVFDVVVDRPGRQYVDILFDRPLGDGKQGTVLNPPPATVEPGVPGTWKWQDTNALRFQPASALPVASEFTFTLKPELLLKEGQVFVGDRELKVVTDRFLVEGVEFQEEPALEGKARILLRGTLKFNYPVNPELLLPKLKLVDPEAKEPVEVKLETGYPAAVINFSTAAIQKQKDERKIALVIDGSLVPEGGTVPLGDDYRQEIPVGSSLKLAVWKVTAEPGLTESTITVDFSSPISAAVAEKYVQIAPLGPKASVRFSADRNHLTLTGDLKAGSTYKLTVGKGMPATDDATLQEAYEEEVEIADLAPSVGFQSQGMFLWSKGRHAVALESVNVSAVRVAIDRVYLNNLFFLFQYGGFFDQESGYLGELQHALGDRLKDETLDVPEAKNRQRVTQLDLDDYVDTKQPGLYRVSVAKPDDSEAQQRWLLLTDLGVVAKQSGDEFWVWISALGNLAPVAGAEVTVRSDQNQVIAQGTSDGAGLFRVTGGGSGSPGSGSGNFKGRTPYMVTVEKGGDFTFLLLDHTRVDTTGLDVGGAEAVGTGYNAFLYGERDLYRPGETAKGVAVVRDGSLAKPPAMPAILRWLDPQGRERGQQKVDINAEGLAEWTLPIPDYALTGHHTLELVVAEKVIGQYHFQVEEFVPDRIKVEIVPPKTNVGPGQKLEYRVASSYLFGPPAANLPVETRVRLVDSTFTAKGFEGFTFRNDERKLDDREVFSAQEMLDEKGEHAFAVTMPDGVPVPSSLEAVITARVSEQGGRGVSGRSRFPVHPYPYYVGLHRQGEEYSEPGRPVTFDYAAVSPEGKPVPSGALRADLFFDRWNTVLRRSSDGYRYESVRQSSLVTSQPIPAGPARGSFHFTPPRLGGYRVVLTDPATQASSQVEIYVFGAGYSPWAIKNPAHLELLLDRAQGEDYQPGDTAHIQVRAPFKGKLLVTVEREKVFHTEIVNVAGNTVTVDVPIRPEYRPNAYVTATLVRAIGDLEPGSVGRAFGAIPLPVARTSNKLNPVITAPAEVRPETELTVAVKAPPGAVVTLAAVDEGILQLIAQKTAQPFDFFYRKLALGVISYDTFSLLLPELKAPKAGGGEGAAGMSQYVRTEGIRRTKPVAFWSGVVIAGPDGIAHFSFKLPEFQGALRLMAVAIDGDRFGSTETLTRVRTPLVVLPTFPRVLSFGESLQVPLTVRNDTGKDGNFHVALAIQGVARADGGSSQNVDVPVGKEKTVYLGVKTGDAAGDVQFVATAEGNGEKTRATGSVGVRADLFPVTTERSGAVTEATLSVPLESPGNYRPGTLVREVRVSPFPLVQFSGKLRDLLRYPYGCVEQTVSTAMPLLYLGDLARELDPEILDPKKGHADPAALVAVGLARLSAMQLPDGGFSLWPGENELYPWGSVYAAHFLVEARRAGHPVDASLYKGALGWVAEDVKAKSTYGTDELQRTAYGLYVLARAGKADPGTMDFLRQKQAKNLTPESRALLAGAYAAAGNPQGVADLLGGVGEIEKVERQTGGNLNSAIRNRALLLLALLDASPKSPRIPALVDRLARDARENLTWTTQETGLAMLALGQLAQRQAQMPPYAGTLYAGNTKVGTFTNKTATFRGLRGTEPLKLVMGPGTKPGAAFFHVYTAGIPTDAAFKPAANGFEIEREILDRDGKTKSLSDVQQGDLLVVKTRVRSTAGPIQNVAIVNLLPSGLEIENARLSTTEQLPWIKDSNFNPAYQDLRDDRVIFFANLPAQSWQTYYTLVRAVAPGRFRLPSIHVEAMYNPALYANGERGEIVVGVRK